MMTVGVLTLFALTTQINADVGDMLRQRAGEMAFSTRANLEVSMLGKAEAAAKKAPLPKKRPVAGGGGGSRLQPGDFGYGDPLREKKQRFGGTTQKLISGVTLTESQPATGNLRDRKVIQSKGDTKGTYVGDFGYGDPLKDKKKRFGGTINTLISGKAATDYTEKPGMR